MLNVDRHTVVQSMIYKSILATQSHQHTYCELKGSSLCSTFDLIVQFKVRIIRNKRDNQLHWPLIESLFENRDNR